MPLPTDTTFRHDSTLTYAAAMADLRRVGVSGGVTHFGASFVGDVALWGAAGLVRKGLAVLGLGLDHERRGAVQGVHDATGRRWGEITYGADGRASVTLCYILAS